MAVPQPLCGAFAVVCRGIPLGLRQGNLRLGSVRLLPRILEGGAAVTRVDYLKVEGLAGRKGSIEINFDPRTNVIFGLNGTGKSSLLRILAASFTNDSESLQKLPFREAEIRFWTHKHAESITRRVRRLESSSITTETIRDADGELVEIEVEEGHSFGEWSTIPLRHSGKRFRCEFLSTFRLAEGARTHRLQLRTEEELNEVFAQQLQSAWRRFSSVSFSEINRIQSAAIVDILASFLSDPEPGAKGISEESAYRRVQGFMARKSAEMPQTRKEFAAAYRSDPKLRAAVASIDDIERRIEEAERPRKKIQEIVEKFVTGPKVIEFSPGGIQVVNEDGEGIDLARLSSGEKQLLRMLVAGVDAERQVMIIDEPELSLHIDWQRDLLGAIESLAEETQVIVATHSPEIMATVSDEQIVSL